jgi:hypothetical protein
VSAAAAVAAGGDLAALAMRLRAEFDASFAAPRPPPPEEGVALLLALAGGRTWALRLAQLEGFAACAGLVALPAQHAACLGLAGFRGRPVPAYSLAMLLGAAVPDATARWLAVAVPGVALVAAGFVGHVRAARGALRTDGGNGALLEHAGQTLPVVDLAILVSPFLTGGPARPGAIP